MVNRSHAQIALYDLVNGHKSHDIPQAADCQGPWWVLSEAHRECKGISYILIALIRPVMTQAHASATFSHPSCLLMTCLPTENRAPGRLLHSAYLNSDRRFAVVSDNLKPGTGQDLCNLISSIDCAGKDQCAANPGKLARVVLHSCLQSQCHIRL